MLWNTAVEMLQLMKNCLCWSSIPIAWETSANKTCNPTHTTKHIKKFSIGLHLLEFVLFLAFHSAADFTHFDTDCIGPNKRLVSLKGMPQHSTDFLSGHNRNASLENSLMHITHKSLD